MFFVVVFCICIVLLLGAFLFPFNERLKANLALVFSVVFFLAIIGCVISNYSDCEHGSAMACEAFNSAIIN